MNAQTLTTIARNAALFTARSTLATVFAFHGSQKLLGWFGGGGIDGTAAYFAGLGVPLPELHALLVASFELAGAAALLSGIGMRIALLPLAVTMLVAAVLGHDGFDVQRNGMEYPLVLATVLPALAAVGPGEWTLARLRPALPRPRSSAGAEGRA